MNIQQVELGLHLDTVYTTHMNIQQVELGLHLDTVYTRFNTTHMHEYSAGGTGTAP